MRDLKKELFEKQDLKYQEFSKRIIDSKYEIIGIRMPELKKMSKEVSTDILEFDNEKYYEEVMLKLLVISKLKDIEKYDYYLNKYINKIDCWSLCDSFVASSKIIKKNKEHYFKVVEKLLKEKYQFSVRVGLVILLNYYVEEEYLSKIFKLVDNIKREEYYIKMAIAWLLSICYIKYQDKTSKYLDNNKLDNFTYNKTISKICDSYRVDKNDKERLKELLTKKTSLI